mmetsp:Transcript_10643/g.20637  ORF Transcript_10643/g.20637 Transcript_10643/m.20637 type:complete len:409 (+) Transcript_10643:75-1301(+)
MLRFLAAIFLFVVCAHARPPSEVLGKAEAQKRGVVWRGNSSEPSSHELLLAPTSLPEAFNWCNVNGTSYCTMSRNQHIPQYCGSCWAHGAVSALADRVKIARKAQGADINPSVQHMLNCNGLGSCKGGFVDGPYQWIHKISKATGTGIAYETSNPYMACSDDVEEGFCPHGDWSCTPINIARTCSTFPPKGFCAGLSRYPNITITEYGSISGAEAMMREIYHRGPISCGIDANPLRTYTHGVTTEKGEMVDHVISVVGWGTDSKLGKFWHIRNSWGEYWGELGYARVQFGALLVEDGCAWAVPGTFTTVDTGAMHCYEDGTNCKSSGPPAPAPHPPSPPAPIPPPTPTPPDPHCHDEAGFCADASIFDPKSDCDLLAKECLKTCGCCGQNPPPHCIPKAADTAQGIIV